MGGMGHGAPPPPPIMGNPGVEVKNFNIIGVQWKIWILGIFTPVAILVQAGNNNVTVKRKTTNIIDSIISVGKKYEAAV